MRAVRRMICVRHLQCRTALINISYSPRDRPNLRKSSNQSIILLRFLQKLVLLPVEMATISGTAFLGHR